MVNTKGICYYVPALQRKKNTCDLWKPFFEQTSCMNYCIYPEPFSQKKRLNVLKNYIDNVHVHLASHNQCPGMKLMMMTTMMWMTTLLYIDQEICVAFLILP